MDLLITNPWFWLVGAVGVVLTGISKSGFGGGAGVLAVPLMALFVPVPFALTVMLPILIVMDAKTIHYYYEHADWQILRRLVPGALVGIFIGGFLITLLSPTLLKFALGFTSIGFALWHLVSGHLKQLANYGLLWGGISGLSSTLIHAGGPPLFIYLLGQQLTKLTWLATAGFYFGAMNLVKLIPYSFVGQWQPTVLLTALLFIPAAYLGVWLGHKLQQHMPEKHFQTICRMLLLVSGVGLLASALFA